MTILKRLAAPLAILTVGLAPALPSHAAGGPHVVTVINGVSFTSATTSVQCSGPLVAVYGSSAISGLITSSSVAFCNSQIAGGTPAGSAIDVEYNTSGDSCPGPNWAATDTTPGDPILAPSDAFPPSCAASGFVTSPVTEVTVNGSAGVVANAVTAVTSCPGAVGPSGQVSGSSGFPAGFGLASSPCLGRAPISGGVCNPGSGAYSDYDTDMSLNAAQNLWAGKYNNLAVLNGCPGVAPARQERITGSGTRITWCYNIFGFAGDNTPNCNNDTTAGAANTTGTMLKDVCGIGNGGVPIDPAGTIGYASRNGTYKNTFLNCDLVGLGGLNAWNGQCDATQVRSVSQPYSGVNTESGASTCNGDLQVTSGRYAAWGYIHLFGHGGFTFASQVLSYLSYLFGTNSGTATAPNYISAPTNLQEATLQSAGFLLKCQMTQSRAFDGGPYSAVTNASC